MDGDALAFLFLWGGVTRRNLLKLRVSRAPGDPRLFRLEIRVRERRKAA